MALFCHIFPLAMEAAAEAAAQEGGLKEDWDSTPRNTCIPYFSALAKKQGAFPPLFSWMFLWKEYFLFSW